MRQLICWHVGYYWTYVCALMVRCVLWVGDRTWYCAQRRQLALLWVHRKVCTSSLSFRRVSRGERFSRESVVFVGVVVGACTLINQEARLAQSVEHETLNSQEWSQGRGFEPHVGRPLSELMTIWWSWRCSSINTRHFREKKLQRSSFFYLFFTFALQVFEIFLILFVGSEDKQKGSQGSKKVLLIDAFGLSCL